MYYKSLTLIAPTQPKIDKRTAATPVPIMMYVADMYKLFRKSISINALSASVHTPTASIAIPPSWKKRGSKVDYHLLIEKHFFYISITGFPNARG